MAELSIEDVNKMRVAMGMKPIPVPGATEGLEFKEVTEDGEEAASTLETREAAMDDNWQKLEKERLDKEERQKRKEALKKAREIAARKQVLSGPTLVDDDEEDMRSWLKGQNKRMAKAKSLEDEEAKREAARKAAISYTERDLAGVKVGHALSEFESGEQILTLADKAIGDESEDDELEAAELLQKRKQEEKNEAKKRKQVYNPQDEDQGLLAQYDEVIDGKKRDGFELSAGGTFSKDQIASGVTRGDDKPKGQLIDLSNLLELDAKPASDYKEERAPKIKKPKKPLKSTKRRKRDEDEDDLLPAAMEVDLPAPKKRAKSTDDNFQDDEDLQAQLAMQRRKALKSRPKMRPEDIAKSIKETEAAEMEDVVQPTEDGAEEGLVFDAMSEFVSGMDPEQRRAEEEEEKARMARLKKEGKSFTPKPEEDEDMTMAELEEAEEAKERNQRRSESKNSPADDEDANFGAEGNLDNGVGAALKLLRERNLVAPQANEFGDYASKQRFLRERARVEEKNEELLRKQREKMRSNTMTTREREEYARQANERNAQQTSRELQQAFERSYKPSFGLSYTDENGRQLSQKEAFKQLSHAFHGKGSGKGKSEARAKKIELEKKAAAQAMLDSSRMTTGLSDSKKNKQAGTRLQ